MTQDVFENKIKPILLWMGTIVSAIMAIAYIIVVCVLIEGFKAETLLNTTIFSLVTAIIGFCIMQMLKIQGQTFAQNIPENKLVIEKYNRTKTKDKKVRSMKYFWVKSVISDVLIKCLTLGATTIGMVYIMIEGSGDYNLLFLAAVNLLMFAGFGLISLCKAYDFFNDNHIPYMLERLKDEELANNSKEEPDQESEAVDSTTNNKAEITKPVEVVKTECTEQGNNSVCTNSRSDILDTSVGTSTNSPDNREQLVVDSNNISDSILGRAIHTSSSTSTGIHNIVEETTQEN